MLFSIITWDLFLLHKGDKHIQINGQNMCKQNGRTLHAIISWGKGTAENSISLQYKMFK